MSLINNDWIYGSHVRFLSSISETLKQSIERDMRSIQFFMGNPKVVSKRAVISNNDIKESLELINNFPVNVFSHFPYCVNLAGSIGNKYLAWSDEKNSESVLLASLKSIEYELGTLAKFDKVKNGVVIHPGNWFDRKEGLLAIAKSINRINFPVNSTLLLENSAGQGNSLATTLEELSTIYKNVDESKQSCIGICIDTCHLFAYGDYDFRDIKEIDRFLKDFDTLFGRSKLKLIHLNDSTKPLKSKKDNHAFIGTGCIWKDNLSSLVYLLNKTKGIPIVLETSPSDMEIIENLNKI